jgi:hypothetical protein
LSPLSMALGKLFGATSYVWFGGVICLAVYAGCVSVKLGIGPALAWAALLAALGVIAQAVALGASLVAARRGRANARIDAFLFPVAGVLAYQIGRTLIEADRVIGSAFRPDDRDWVRPPTDVAAFFGVPLDARAFAFAIIGTVLAWALISVWRLMRVELQARPSPVFMFGFLLVPIMIAAGLGQMPMSQVLNAYMIVHILALCLMFAEPKDLVSWRAFARDAARTGLFNHRWPAPFTGLIVAFAAAAVLALITYVDAKLLPASTTAQGSQHYILRGFAGFSFLLREAAIIAFFHLGARQRRGDFAALVTIALLVFAGPVLMGILGMEDAKALFFVHEADQTKDILSIASGLVQAAIFGVLAQGRGRQRSAALA